MSTLQQTSVAPSLSELASPLNSARSTQSARAAARRVGMETHGVHILTAKRAALVRLADKEAEEEATTMRELESFDARLATCLRARPKLADSGTLSPPRTLPISAAEEEEQGSGTMHSRAPRAAKPAAKAGGGSSAAVRAFKRIDRDGSGVLTRKEILKALREDATVRRLLGLEQFSRQHSEDHDAFEAVFQGLDADDSKTIGLAEFEAAFGAGVTPRVETTLPAPSK